MTTIKSYEKKDGKTYFWFKLYIGVDPLTGKEQYTTRRGFKSEKEAKKILTDIQNAIYKGEFRKKKTETFQDLYDLWVEKYERTVEESTFVKTTRIFRNHILPAIGECKIDKINFKLCEEAVIKWSEVLVNFQMVKSYASAVIEYAIKLDYLEKNPFKLVDTKNKKKNAPFNQGEKLENFYTKNQLIHIIDCFKQGTNVKAYVLFHLLAFSGMRKGEALGLTWEDIDFKKKEIRIEKALSKGKNNRLYLKSTKTGDIRTIKMYPEMVSVLEEWKKVQHKEYLQLGFDTHQANQLVFSNTLNTFLQPCKTGVWLNHVLKKYKLPKITTHGFRHTHCSLLFEAGATIKEVQDRLGHSDVKTTMDIYAHVSNEVREGAVNKLESYMIVKKNDHGFDHGHLISDETE